MHVQGFDLNKMRYILPGSLSKLLDASGIFSVLNNYNVCIFCTHAGCFVQQQIICVVDSSLTRQNSQHAEVVNWIWYRNSA